MHLSNETACGNTTPVIVDRINTMKIHRKDVFSSMKSVGFRVVVIWEMAVPDSIARIKSRGVGHKSIKPSDNIGMIVGRTSKELEQLTQEEITEYRIEKVIRITNPEVLTRTQVVKQILDGLAEIYPSLVEISDKQIEKAMARTIEREERLCDENSKPSMAVRRTAGRDTTAKHPPTVSCSSFRVNQGIYQICFDDTTRFTSIYDSLKCNPKLACKNEFHVTLLYMPHKLVRRISGHAKAHSSENSDHEEFSVDEYRDAIRFYESAAEIPIAVRPVYVAQNDRVAVMRVDIIDKSVRYFDVVPHISLAKVPEARFRECNDLVKHVDAMRSKNIVESTISWTDLERDDEIIGSIRYKTHG